MPSSNVLSRMLSTPICRYRQPALDQTYVRHVPPSPSSCRCDEFRRQPLEVLMVLNVLQRIDRNTTITQQREDDEQVDRFGKQVQSVPVAVPSQTRMNHDVIPRPYNLL